MYFPHLAVFPHSVSGKRAIAAFAAIALGVLHCKTPGLNPRMFAEREAGERSKTDDCADRHFLPQIYRFL
jgi:hypothetical protein